jgi:hypothetical protein
MCYIFCCCWWFSFAAAAGHCILLLLDRHFVAAGPYILSLLDLAFCRCRCCILLSPLLHAIIMLLLYALDRVICILFAVNYE